MTKVIELNQRLNELDKEIKAAADKVRLGTATEQEYSKLYSERVALKRELDQSKETARLEKANKDKRPLPDVPKEYLTHKYYFDKKAELEQRENDFKQSYRQAVEHVEDVTNKYDDAVLNGTDDDINALYDELQQAKKQKAVMQSKVESLQDTTKQKTLEDTAMEVILSRVHVDEMIKEDRAELVSRYEEAKRLMEAAQNDIEKFNSDYDKKINDFHKVVFDLGDNSGLGLSLISKYQKHPGVMRSNKRIKI